MTAYADGYNRVMKTAGLGKAHALRNVAERILRAAELNPNITGGVLGGGTGAASGYAIAPEGEEILSALAMGAPGVGLGALGMRSAPAMRKLRELQGHVGYHPHSFMHSWSQSLDNVSPDPLFRHYNKAQAAPLTQQRQKDDVVDLISRLATDRTRREVLTSTPAGPLKQVDDGRHFYLDIPTSTQDIADRTSYILLRGNRHGLDPGEGLRSLQDHIKATGHEIHPLVRKQVRESLQNLTI